MCVSGKEEKKGKGKHGGRWGGEGSKWFGSVSVTANPPNHLPPSNKIEHQAEPNNCQTPRHHPNREEIASERGEGMFSKRGQVETFQCEAALLPFGQGELKEPLSSKSNMTFISWGDGVT